MMNGLDVFIDERFRPLYERHPIVLADVGARGGIKSNWLPARRHLRVLGFEPDTTEFERLVATADGTTTFFNTALHNQRGTVPLYVARDRGLTSIYKPNRAFVDAFPQADRFDTTSVVEMHTDTLDSVAAEHGIEDVDFIKADTQGSELHVLQGARGVLSRSTLGVEVEVEFAPIYEGQPLFADVDRHLRGLGFLLFDLRPVYWKRTRGRAAGGPHGQIIWADALYFRDTHALAAAGADLERSKARVLKAVSIAVLYGYIDYALDIAASRAADVLASDERDAVVRYLSALPSAPGTLPDFPGRRGIAAAIHRVWRLLSRPTTDAWSVSRASLGNKDR